MIVVDTSAVLEVLLNTRASARIAERLFAPNETLHAPHLLDAEIAQVLRRYARAGELDAARGRQALDDLADLPLSRYPHDLFLRRIWELRSNVTAYDAAYLALAEAVAAPRDPGQTAGVGPRAPGADRARLICGAQRLVQFRGAPRT